MEARAIESLADALAKGELPEAQTWDVGAAVRLIADSLAGPGREVGAESLRLAMRVLNKRRLFEHTRLLGEAWRATRGFDPTILRHHAQALINLGALDAAEALLRDGLARMGPGAQAAAEELEYQGLLGRIDKQRFVASGDLDALARATGQYYAQYARPEKPFWHGINAVALRTCEERRNVSRPGIPASRDLADVVRKQVLALVRRDTNDPWIPATLSEAELALGRCDQAELWLYRFLHHRSVQPFDVESYERQLREIWQGSAAGDGGNCADRLVAIITRHVARTQGKWSVSAAEVPAIAQALESDPRAFEKNFSGEGTFSVDMVRRMLGVCSSIGCVCNAAGERLGTGFLVEGSWLRDAYGAGPVFVTNAHVISTTVANAIRPQDVRVSFEVDAAADASPAFYRIKELLYTSPPGDLGVRCGACAKLDVTIVRLDGLPVRFTGLGMAGTLPLVEPRAKAYVVGHPRGSGLQLSLNDSLLLDIDDDERLLHYRTPTDPGSSGSPVFNARWEVIAIHHGGSSSTPRLHGSGLYEANEGIALPAIRRALDS